MAPRWTPKEIRNMTLISTACLCLLVLITGVMFGVLTGKISVDALGKIQGLSVGSGLLGFGLILYWIIKIPFFGDRRNGNTK
jgi:hypothetical protein